MTSLASRNQETPQNAVKTFTSEYDAALRSGVPTNIAEQNVLDKLSRGSSLGSLTEESALLTGQNQILERQVKIEFNGSLMDLTQGMVNVWSIPHDNVTIFQKQIKTNTGKTEFVGDCRKAIIISCSANRTKTTFPIDTCINIKGIPGGIHFQNGKSALVSLPEGIKPETTLEKVFQIDSETLQPAQLQLASISEESLKQDYGPLPFNTKDFGPNGQRSLLKNACLVRVDSPITKVLKASHKEAGLNLAEIPIIELHETSFYPLNKELVEVCVADILEKVNNAEVPWTNLFKLEATLEREDGKSWSSITSHPCVTKNCPNESIKQHTLNKNYTASCVVTLRYAIPNEN